MVIARKWKAYTWGSSKRPELESHIRFRGTYLSLGFNSTVCVITGRFDENTRPTEHEKQNERIEKNDLFCLDKMTKRQGFENEIEATLSTSS